MHNEKFAGNLVTGRTQPQKKKPTRDIHARDINSPLFVLLDQTQPAMVMLTYIDQENVAIN